MSASETGNRRNRSIRERNEGDSSVSGDNWRKIHNWGKTIESQNDLCRKGPLNVI